MVTATRRAAVAVVLFLVLGILFGTVVARQVGAAETSPQTVQSGTLELTSESTAESEVVMIQEEIPLAEAKASSLETQTQEKGMPSFLGFVLVAAAACVTGVAVAMRAKLGRNRQGYVPTEDLTIFRVKK